MAKTNAYWKKLVRDKAYRDNNMPTGYLGVSWREMDAEDLLNIIHILYAENRELKERVAKLDVEAFQKAIKDA